MDKRNNLDLLNRRDTQRDQILSTFLAARNKEIQARAAISSHVPMDVFGEVDGSSLSPGYQRLLEVSMIYAKQKLGTGGFLDPLPADEKDFLATAKAAIFTVNESWYKVLYSLGGDDEMKSNEACSSILSRLFQNLYGASTFDRKHILSSYHHRLYIMMKDRNLPPWNIVKAKLPVCLRTNNTPVRLLIQCLSAFLLDWVYAAMSARLCKNRIEDPPKASSSEWCRTGRGFVAVEVVFAFLDGEALAGEALALSVVRPFDTRLAGSVTPMDEPDSSFPKRSIAWSKRKELEPSMLVSPSDRRERRRKKVWSVRSTL